MASERAGQGGADKPDERASRPNRPEKGTDKAGKGRVTESNSNGKKTVIMHKAASYRLDEIEDQFEEFEPARRSQAQMEAEDKVTIWMNSWMDEDDGDFKSISKDCKK